MTCYLSNGSISFLLRYYRFVVAVVVVSKAAGAAGTRTTGPRLAVDLTTPIIAQRRTTAGTVTPTTAGVRVPIDYNYVDLDHHTGPTEHESTVRPAATLPRVDITGHTPAASHVNWAAPPAELDGIQGDQQDWLRERVNTLQRHGLNDQLDALQSEHPSDKLALPYDFYNNGGPVHEDDDTRHYNHNGSYHLSPGYREDVDGFWNETFYPSLAEYGHFVSGTPYVREREIGDGYVYNGTYSGGEPELPDGENGYFYNGTKFDHEEEQAENEDLMRRQLLHPKWTDGAANNADNGNSPPPIQNQMHQRTSPRKWEGHPVPPSPGQHPQLQPHQPYRHPGFLQDRHRLPIVQQRQPVNRPAAVQYSSQHGVATQQHRDATAAFGKNELTPTQTVYSGVEATSGSSGKSAMVGNEPSTEQLNTPTSSSISQTASWGIALAVVLVVAVVTAPILCLLHKYRQVKRIKKRTFLRRPEHGSVDEGIMIMTEFGEKVNSRVRIFT